jgi:hypothetical protein
LGGDLVSPAVEKLEELGGDGRRGVGDKAFVEGRSEAFLGRSGSSPAG